MIVHSFLTILDADVRFAQLLHSIATKVIISKKTVKLLPTVDSQRIVYALNNESKSQNPVALVNADIL